MDQNQLLRQEDGNLDLLHVRGRGDGDGGDELEYDEAAIEKKAAEYKSAALDHMYTGSPLVLPPRTRISLPPMPAWPSPLEEALGDMENKALQRQLDLNNVDTSMYPLHTSLLESGQTAAGIDETSQSFLDMLNADESTLSSLGEVELEDSNSIPHKPRSPYAGKVDKESLEKSIREAEDILSDASLNFSRLEPRIIEFKEAISKRDNIIKQLISSHEVVQKQLEEKEEELRKTHLMADELSKLKSTIEEFAGSAESLRHVRLADFSLPFNSTAESVPENRSKENADQVGQTAENEKPSPVPNHEEWCDLEDFKLKIADLEKKLEAKNKYIEELTVERETERDEFHRELENSDKKFTELKREKERLEEINAEHRAELNDYEERLKEADQVEQQLVDKSKHSEEELKIAVEKIYELREIIRDLEHQIDSASTKATELKEQNELLTDELDRLEHKEKDETLQSQETLISTVPDVVIEEIQTQIHDLTSKLEKKLVEMDGCPWSTRPSSACSGGQYMSNEDVSVKEINLSRTTQSANPYAVTEGLCRLEAHFDSLMRFEELIIKKVKDNEIRYGTAKQRNEELENEKLALQEALKEQILKISDLQGRLDQVRFEPSPNAVTLTGLRARVQLLSEQLEEYKGKLQLKMIENQDIEQKLASAQALLAKYTAQQQQQQQQQQAAAKKMECAIVQTDPVIILRQMPNKAKSVSVQTVCAGVQTEAPWGDSQPSESLEFSPSIHSTPTDPLAESRRKKSPTWANKMERRSPEALRCRETGELPSTPSLSLSRVAETDLVSDSTQKELAMVVRKNQDLEQKLAFAQELIVKLQQTTKVVKIGSTQTEGQSSQLDISTTIQKNAELQNELASARLLISKLQFQAPKNVATTQTDAVALHSISAQTDAAKGPTKLHSEVQTESIKLTCGHESEILAIQRKNRDLEYKLSSAHEAIIKLQQTKPKRVAITQTENKILTSFGAQTDPVAEPVRVNGALIPATVPSKPAQNMSSRPSFPLNFEVHSKHSKSSISNDSWCAADGEEEVHGVQRKYFLCGDSYELYLRIKSHRKALCWQKRYLTQVVHGYKDLLIETGVGTQHPDYFKKQLSLVPGAIGVVDRRSPLIRFRIMVRVVIAATRMQRMVSRWKKRLRHHSFEGAKENSPPPPSFKHPHLHAGILPLKIPPGASKTELRNVLTQHYERFKTLEDEIAHTMTNRLKRK